MKPHHPRALLGIFEDASGDMAMCQFAVGIATNTPAYVRFRHQSDGYTETRPFTIKSIERNKYPHPHVVTGILQIDLNRPGQDAGDDAHDVNVIVEMWPYPKTYVYYASHYEKPTEEDIREMIE